MAAGQQKKRLNAANVVSCNLQEQYRAKKKKNIKLPRIMLNLRSHISLEWDDNQKKAVAKREQIGITWRELAPFVDSVTNCHLGLADVFDIPQEFFGMENLTRVLSYEIWKTYLSETERDLLTQFLPRGTDADHVVQALLVGDNFHFGNPFLKWGASLCSGNLHPDVILCQEQCFKANRKAYYLELQKYHYDILGTLQKWKERWESCKDPEKDILQKMWRPSRKHAENSISSHANESRQCDEENLTASAGSSSWASDEIECNSNGRSISLKIGELQEKKGIKGLTDYKHGNPLAASDRPKVITSSRKEERSHKLSMRSDNDAKYMSFFKISRKQHQLITKMKQSADGIQSKSLTRLLGDIKGFHVQPYETFEEEERMKLHKHWVQLARRDLPAAFANWSRGLLQRHEWRKSLGQEMAEKKKPVMEEDERNDHSDSVFQEQRDNEETYDGANLDLQNSEEVEEFVPHPKQSQSLPRIPSLNGYNEVNPIDMDSEVGSQNVLKQDDAMPNLSEFIGTVNPNEDAVERKLPITSAINVLSAAGVQNSYYPSIPLSHGYTPPCELSLRQPEPIEEESNHLIDIKSLEQVTRKSLLHTPPGDLGSALHINNSRSLISSFSNPNHNEVLPSFLKVDNMIPSYPLEHKQVGLQFLPTNDGSLERGLLSEHFRESPQLQMLRQNQMRERELHMQQIIQKSMYSNGGRYPISAQELFSPMDVQDWTISQSLPLNGGEFSRQNWFSGEHQAHGIWSGGDVCGPPRQAFGNGSNTDETLYSVLSQCNKLQYNPMSTVEQHIPGRNSRVEAIHSNNFPQSTHQLNCLGGHEACSTLTSSATVTAPAMPKANNMSWMNLPHQNSGIHDSTGKPFLRSWNQ